MRLRRSVLSVPATRPEFHAKAEACAADEVFLDLEDSVAPAAKERGRELAVEALNTLAFAGKTVGVRVNACDTRWCFEDVAAVVSGAPGRVDVIIVPKVEGAADVHFLDRLLTQLEARHGLERPIGLELQVESARGLVGAESAAAASPRVEALVFGPGDFAADLRMPALAVGAGAGEAWQYVRMRMLVAARAAGVQAIDGPHAAMRDPAGLRASAGAAARLGYDGKWALSPAQVGEINAAFSPGGDELERARRIVDAYARASTEDARGAVLVDGEMVDEATRKMAESLVARARAAGL